MHRRQVDPARHLAEHLASRRSSWSSSPPPPASERASLAPLSPRAQRKGCIRNPNASAHVSITTRHRGIPAGTFSATPSPVSPRAAADRRSPARIPVTCVRPSRSHNAPWLAPSLCASSASKRERRLITVSSSREEPATSSSLHWAKLRPRDAAARDLPPWPRRRARLLTRAQRQLPVAGRCGWSSARCIAFSSASLGRGRACPCSGGSPSSTCRSPASSEWA